MADAISLSQVSVTLPGSTRPVLRDVDLRIDEGELALVVGRTGSGKSTLLGAMCGRVPHFTGGTLTGHVRLHGRDTRDHRPRDLADLVGVVGQDPLAGFVTDTVEEELAYGMEQLGLPAATMRKRVEETLDLLGIAELRDVPLRELSGGQQQRVAIGSVLTAHPRVILLDEPTSALDPTGAEEVLATITRLVHDLGGHRRRGRAPGRAGAALRRHRRARVAVRRGALGAARPTSWSTATSRPPSSSWAGTPGGRRCRCRCATPGEPPAACAPASRRPCTPADTIDRWSKFARRRAPLRVPPWTLVGAGVVVRYPGDVLAVAGVDLDLHAGEVTAVMGRNGCGKSSLLWALQGSGVLTSGHACGADARPAAASARPPARHPRPSSRAPSAAGERRSLVGLVPQTAADLLYLDTVGAECDQADRESGVPSGTCASLLEAVAPGIPARAAPSRPVRRAEAGPRARRAADRRPAGAAARRAHPRPRPHGQGGPEPGAARPRRSAAARSWCRPTTWSSSPRWPTGSSSWRRARSWPTGRPPRSSCRRRPSPRRSSKVTAPGPWLTVDDVREALAVVAS